MKEERQEQVGRREGGGLRWPGGWNGEGGTERGENGEIAPRVPMAMAQRGKWRREKSVGSLANLT